jgi:WD40 repeat protein/tetratricopeptide (TPR) repeat protein
MPAPVFVNDGRDLVTITGPKQLRLWNCRTGRPEVNALIVTQAQPLWGVAASADGWLVTAFGSLGVPFGPELFRLPPGAPETKTLEHRNYVTQAVFSPDHTLLVTTSWDRTAKLWSLPEGTLVGSPLLHQGNVHRAAFSPDSRFLATVQSDGLVRVWRGPAGRPTDHTMLAHPNNNVAVLSPDGQCVVASRFKFFGWGLSDNQVCVHDVATGLPLGPVIRLDGVVREAALALRAMHVAIAYQSSAETTGAGRLALHDFTTGAPAFAPLALPGVPSAIAFSADGKCLAAYSRGGSVSVIESASGRVIHRLRHKFAGGRLQGNDRVLFTPDGSSLITLGEDRKVQVWDLQRGILRFPALEPSPVSDVAVSPDGRWLATGTYLGIPNSNILRVWDIGTGRAVSPPMTHPDWIFQVVFSADGRRVLTGARDGRARLWDWKAGRLAGQPMNHEDEVYGVALTPDGHWGLTACRDGNVHLWDLSLARPVGPTIAAVARPGAAAFNVAVPGDGIRAVAGTGEPHLLSIDLSGLDERQGPNGNELAALAEVTSGLRIDAGNLSNLTAGESLDRWRAFRRRRPGPLDAPVAEATALDSVAALIQRYPNLPTARIARGRIYAERGDTAAADADFAVAAAQAGIGTQSFLDAGWWVVGPFEESLATPFPPESDPDPGRSVASGAGSAPLRWRSVSPESPGNLNLAAAIGRVDHCSAYALTYVVAPAPHGEIWAIGSDDHVKLWLNGQPIYQRTVPNSTSPDHARVRVELRAGRNTVLARVANVTGPHRLYLRYDSSRLAAGMFYASQGDWDRADAAFAQAVDSAPADLDMLRTLAVLQGRHARWDALTTTYDRLLAAGTTEPWDLFRSTALFLKRGGLEEFRGHRRRMLELFGKTTDARLAARIGKACLLAPLPGPDQDEGVRLARRADVTAKAGSYLPWNCLARSLAELRGGHPAEAAAFARRVTEYRPELWAWNYSAYAVLSLSLVRLGQIEEARTPLARARAVDRKRIPKPGSDGFSAYWVDKVIGDGLVREAELALLDHDFPGDPFTPPETAR